MELGIKGRSAIVTGGSRGIGYETAKRLLAEGVRVTICSRKGDQLEQAREQLARDSHATGGEVEAVVADMTREADIERLVAAAAKRFGTVDILVNNAGQMHVGRFGVMTDDGLKLQLETKLFGFMRAIRLVYPMMKERGWGRILNIIGGAGKEPDHQVVGSSITNAALLALTKCLSVEWGEQGIHVNAICPGYVDTDNWVRHTGALGQEYGAKNFEDLKKSAAKRNSLNRFGRPEELADAIAFLCSERASYLTGVSLNTDGGRLKALW